MKKFYSLLLVTLTLAVYSPSKTYGQAFSNNTSMPIPDSSMDLMVPVIVSGLPVSIDTAFGLSQLCFDILHQFDANLRISLQSPDGNRISIVDQKGGNGQNFTGTCVKENAAGGWIMNANAPFTGNYYPQQSLNMLNNAQNPNGTWYLVVNDLFTPSDTGIFQSVSILFSSHPPANPLGAGPCTDANAGGCQCPDLATGDCDLLPDIAASPLSIVQDHTEFPGYIEVGVATPNIGWGPLEIHGIQSCFCDTTPVACSTTLCPNGQPPKQLVNQRIYHKNGNTMTHYDRPAGTMSYHPAHSHIHVDDWVYNSVRVQTPDPDPRNWPIIGAGTKISFCLINLFSCDTHFGFCEDSLGNYLHVADFPNANFGNVSGCTLDQGIYVGNADEYNSWLAGQEIYIPNACNETYYIVSIIDPLNHFIETNETNNWTAVPITLTMQANGNLETPGFMYTITGNAVDFMANASTPDSCVWNWGDGTSSVTPSVIANHMYAQAGTYIVSLSAYNHCGPSVSADTVMILPTGMDALANAVASFEVFPNPSKDKADITYTLINSDDVTLEVSTMEGKKVKSIHAANQLPGKYKVQLDRVEDSLDKGVYVARLSTRSGTRIVKFILL